jgi:hypothetical protein
MRIRRVNYLPGFLPEDYANPKEDAMANQQNTPRPEDAAVSHIEPTAAEQQPAKDTRQPNEAAKPQTGKDQDDKGAVGLDALNP